MRKWIRPLALVFVLALLLTACGQKSDQGASAPAGGSEPASQGSGSSPETPKKTWSIKVAAPVTPPLTVHIPVYVAKEQGFLAEEGITEVEIFELEGGVGTARALASGQVHFAGTSADPIIAAATQGGGVKAIYSYAPRVSVAMVASPDIKQPVTLKGRNIGIQEKNGFADVLSRLVLSKAGVAETDVQFISTSTAGRLQALLEGQTDTAILHVDQTFKALEAKPDLVVLAKIWETDPNWWYSAFATSDQLIKEDPALVEAFVRAMIKTHRWMYQHKDEVVDIIAKYNDGFTKEIYAQSYDTLAAGNGWPVNEGVSREIVEYTVRKQMEIGILQVDKAPTFEDIVDISFAQKVVQELGRQGDGL